MLTADLIAICCRHQSPSVLVPALRTVGNIVTGDDLQTQVIINCGALGCLLHLLTTSQKKSIKKVPAVASTARRARKKSCISHADGCRSIST